MQLAPIRSVRSFPRFTFLQCGTCGHRFLNQVATSPSCLRCGSLDLRRLGLDTRAAAAVGDGAVAGLRTGQR